MPHTENDHVVATSDEARAAVSGQHMRYVLTASTLAVAVLFVAVYLYFFA